MISAPHHDLVRALRAAIGEERVTTESTALAAAAVDRWPLVEKWSAGELAAHHPLAVVRPRTTAEVAAAVRVARARGATIVPRGAGSGVTGAAVPDGRSIVIDLTAMDALLAFSAEDSLVTVQAGHLAGALESWLNARGHTLGHYPQSLHLASMGGLVATRSSGTFSTKYGGIENLVLGLEVVTAGGEVTRYRTTPRAAVGPQLLQLHVGAEGALGVITEVTVKAFALPEHRRFVGYAFPSVAAGLQAVRAGFGRQLVPAVLRLYDEVEAVGLYRRVGSSDGRPLLIVGHEGVREVAEAEASAFAATVAAGGGEPLGPAIGEAWESHRFDASWLMSGNAGQTAMADAIEVAGEWSKLLPIFTEVTGAITPLATRVMSHFSHFYPTGGSIYFIVQIESASAAEVRRRYQAVWDAAMEATIRGGGAISHHHGVGLVRANLVERYLGSGFATWRSIKNALDGSSLFTPGKMGFGSHERDGDPEG